MLPTSTLLKQTPPILLPPIIRASFVEFPSHAGVFAWILYIQISSLPAKKEIYTPFTPAVAFYLASNWPMPSKSMHSELFTRTRTL
jgi:hypothetical protein